MEADGSASRPNGNGARLIEARLHRDGLRFTEAQLHGRDARATIGGQAYDTRARRPRHFDGARLIEARLPRLSQICQGRIVFLWECGLDTL